MRMELNALQQKLRAIEVNAQGPPTTLPKSVQASIIENLQLGSSDLKSKMEEQVISSHSKKDSLDDLSEMLVGD